MTLMETRPNASSRDALVAAILEFFVGHDLLALQDIRTALEREIDDAGPGALVALRGRLAADNGWDYYPRDPLAQRIHHLLADRFLNDGSQIQAAHYLDHLGDAPLTIVSNHLSYADANAIEILLQRSGGEALANRLTALAGPKVFTSKKRRFSSLCFGTIKVPQSAEVSSEEAVLNPREVARAARRAIDVAHTRLRAGDALLLFGEGTRSRTARMQRMLPGVARYLEVPGTWVLPVGLAGPEALFSVSDSTLRPARIVMQLGRPFRADALLACAGQDRRLAMDAIGLAIAELIPAGYRGVYENSHEFPEAGDVLRQALT